MALQARALPLVAALTASALGVLAAHSRVAVPGSGGCNLVTDRTACCLFVDGRADPAYSGQECVPAREGGVFFAGSDAVCQPNCWVHGTCGEMGDQSDLAGTCEAPTWYLLGGDRACRSDHGDTTVDGRRTVDLRGGVADLESCKGLCSASELCRGIEFSAPLQHCELWTRPIGYTVTSPGFQCWARAAPARPALPAGVVEQVGAKIPVGGDVRFYAVGTSNAAWQTWPDQLHAMLRRLGFNVNMQGLDVPGALVQPSKAPVCADADSYSSLSTPRLGMIGWSSWGFAYESKADCDADGYRQIAGYPVSCTNAWACNPAWQGSVPSVNATRLAEGLSHADFVVLSNWINDAKAALQAGPRETCYKGADIDLLGSTDVTAANLKRLIRAIHAQNPNVIVLVLARYADTFQTVYPNEQTLPRVQTINSAVRAKIQDEPNTLWVDFSFPLGEEMFQTLSKVHPNCRGDKVMATSIVETLFGRKVLSRGLALAGQECLSSSACSSLDVACCQRSALCAVAADGSCVAYGPGDQEQ